MSRDHEIIFNLASCGVSPQVASIEDMRQVNAESAIRLFKIANEVGVKKFIGIGTCLEYGREAEKWEKYLRQQN